jgi:L-malate glycosyltransferase
MLVLALARHQRETQVPTAVIALYPSQVSFKCEIDALRSLGCVTFEPISPLTRSERAMWIRRSVLAFNADVIFAHSLLPSVWARLGLLGLSGRHLVHVLHSCDDYGNFRARWFEKLTWRLNTMVVSVSEEGLLNFQRRITNTAPMDLIPNGVNVEKVRAAWPKRDLWRQETLGALPKEILLLQVGRIGAGKQQALTVEMFARLVPLLGAKSVRLVFAGLTQDLEYLAGLEAIVREAGLKGRVQFLGPRSDIPELLAAADLYLMPSREEAQGTAALEALASGIFCIFSPLTCFLPYSKLPGVKILEEGTNARDFASEVRKLLCSGAVLGRYERSLAQYDINRCTQAYLDLSRRLCGGVTPAPHVV